MSISHLMPKPRIVDSVHFLTNGYQVYYFLRISVPYSCFYKTTRRTVNELCNNALINFLLATNLI